MPVARLKDHHAGLHQRVVDALVAEIYGGQPRKLRHERLQHPLHAELGNGARPNHDGRRQRRRDGVRVGHSTLDADCSE